MILYIFSKEPNGEWGFEMVDKASSMNASWRGVMGGVITGQYDMSLSAWLYQEQRSRVLSFSTLGTQVKFLVTTPQEPNIDFGLLVRPLTNSAWRGIVGVLLVTYLATIVIKSNGSEDTTYKRMLAISTWIFFVLLNSFYGGAMTMFFANEVTLPFENIRDVLQAYPEWDLLGNIQI